MNTALLIAMSYLVGSIPTGYWVVKGLKNIDLRQVGSGSTGTTNVLRTAGKGAAAFVFVVDIAKGVIPVMLAVHAATHNMLPELPAQVASWLPLVVALVTLIGHSKSIFLNFQGGKSAATGLGTIAAMSLPAALGSFAVFIAVLKLFKIVSLSSISAAISSVFLMALFAPPNVPLHVSFLTYCGIGATYVIWRHKDNIKRLMAGTEPKIGQKLEDAAKVKMGAEKDAEKSIETGAKMDAEKSL